MVAATEVENLEFKWGKKRGIGGKKRDIQFYETFTYDGLEYSLYDNVYISNEGKPPYLGKLIKIWEHPDKLKKVKILWFFQSSEISNYLVSELTHPKEVFLASGEGAGLANINPLEAIAGKCNIVCISKDSRNRQPSDEELTMADYVFHRTFDVGQCIILDKIDDKIAGIDAKFIFNPGDYPKHCTVSNLNLDNEHASENANLDNEHASENAKETNERLITSKLNTSENSIPEDDRQEEQKQKQKPVVGERLSGDDRQDNVCKCKTESKVEENSDVKVSSVNPNIREKPVSGVGTESAEQKNTNDKPENTSRDKIGSRSKVEENAQLKESSVRQEFPSGKKTGSFGNSFANQAKVDEKLKSIGHMSEWVERPHKKAKLDSSVELCNEKNKNNVLKPNEKNSKPPVHSGELVERPHKKAKLDSSVEVSNDKNKNNVLKLNEKNSKSSVPNITASEDKSRCATDLLGTAKNSSKKLKVDDKLTKPTNCKLSKNSPSGPPKDGIESSDKPREVTRRPDSDRSKWFAELPWEERMRDAHERGTLVLFQNLDPAYTSADVEDIVWNAFKETCRAKMVQWTAYFSPHFGQAFAIFKTSKVAEEVVTKLDEGCLLLANRRPLVASLPNPCFSRKVSTFAGHLIVDKLKAQREMKAAVSTSHSSQPNTLEYEMAMEWCLQIERFDQYCKKLYERHGKELGKLKANFKSK